MGQEDYLNSLLNSLTDTEEKRDSSLETKLDKEEEIVIDPLEGMSANNGNASVDIFADSGEEEPLVDVFVDNGEEEPLEDIFADSGEEEPLEDVFADNGEEEPLEDIFADSGEEEPIEDVFADGGEEEPLEDVFADNGEEEPLEDIFADNGEEEPLEDIFADNGEEEPQTDALSDDEEYDPLADIFVNNNYVDSSENEETDDAEDDLIRDIINEYDAMGEMLEDAEEITEASEDGEALLNSIEGMLGNLEDEEAILQNSDRKVVTNDSPEEAEDIFAMLNNSGETVDLETGASEEPDVKNIFDEDLMKLLGEEDLSGEEAWLGEEETEDFLLADGKGTKMAEEVKDKKKEKGGLFSKVFKGKEEKETKADGENVEESAPKEKPKKEKKEKPKKEKKEKKEKKPKKEKPKKEKVKKPEVIEEPLPPLHKGQVVAIFVLCISIGAFVIICSKLIPYTISVSAAQNYYEREDYENAYRELQGLTIQESDTELYHKAQTIMLIKNQWDSYTSYDSLGMTQEALSSLLKGVSNYDEFYSAAEQYGVSAYYDTMLEQITSELSAKYEVSLETARVINESEDAETYSAQIYSIIEQ
ncbi:hypothetical protein [Konateibacter massiliensis]|uniref:hypothetical protein n=1 Tax=Konateibacter massiliensis TaxID=2002841 RepID=UPI000C14C65B|nr:hypothetical protein [Konateibacter massiliensis]